MPSSKSRIPGKAGGGMKLSKKSCKILTLVLSVVLVLLVLYLLNKYVLKINMTENFQGEGSTIKSELENLMIKLEDIQLQLDRYETRRQRLQSISDDTKRDRRLNRLSLVISAAEEARENITKKISVLEKTLNKENENLMEDLIMEDSDEYIEPKNSVITNQLGELRHQEETLQSELENLKKELESNPKDQKIINQIEVNKEAIGNVQQGIDVLESTLQKDIEKSIQDMKEIENNEVVSNKCSIPDSKRDNYDVYNKIDIYAYDIMPTSTGTIRERNLPIETCIDRCNQLEECNSFVHQPSGCYLKKIDDTNCINNNREIRRPGENFTLYVKNNPAPEPAPAPTLPELAPAPKFNYQSAPAPPAPPELLQAPTLPESAMQAAPQPGFFLQDNLGIFRYQAPRQPQQTHPTTSATMPPDIAPQNGYDNPPSQPEPVPTPPPPPPRYPYGYVPWARQPARRAPAARRARSTARRASPYIRPAPTLPSQAPM